MLVLKAMHIVAMVCWFSGLFYLPRLFVYHAEARDELGLQRFKRMERRLYYCITWPSALLTTAFGVGLIAYNPSYYLGAHWMQAKINLVVLLWAYHLACGYHLNAFAWNRNKRSALFYRVFNEVPTLLLLGIVLLVVLKPD